MSSVPDATGFCPTTFSSNEHGQPPKREADNPQTILEEALGKVYGDRQASYGHPREDFECQAAMMSPLVWRWLRVRARSAGLLDELDTLSPALRDLLQTAIQPEMIGSLMECVKLARWAHSQTRDTGVDRAGYAQADCRLVGIDP